MTLDRIMKEKLKNIVLNQRKFYNSFATKSYEFRLENLKKLKKAIIKFEDKLSIALKKDLGKSKFESYTSEIGFCLYSLSDAIKNLKKWMSPKKVKTPFILQPASSKIYYVPRGVTLIISPFNYPVGLSLIPLINSICAGNTAILKTASISKNVAEELEALIEDTFSPNYISCVSGEVEETTILLEQKFDYIFFTGSPRVGSIVMQAAAKNLTPVALELGGKSPCIVHSDASIDITVSRIAYGKFMNTGQTCVAPDYILIHKDIKDEFIQKLKQKIINMYGKDISLSPDFGRIANEQHCERIINLINKEKVVFGGEHNIDDKYISPTIMDNVSINDKIMQEEIFGPVLPILTYSNFDEVFNIINKLPQHPLACYVFSQNKSVQNELMSKIQFGGGCINHCIQHLVNPNLPFGGVGNSGIGSYHGFSGFENFSHKKSILKASTWIDLPLAYPPYKEKLKTIKKMLN